MQVQNVRRSFLAKGVVQFLILQLVLLAFALIWTNSGSQTASNFASRMEFVVALLLR